MENALALNQQEQVVRKESKSYKSLTVSFVDNILEDQQQKVLISHKERNRDGAAPELPSKRGTSGQRNASSSEGKAVHSTMIEREAEEGKGNEAVAKQLPLTEKNQKSTGRGSSRKEDRPLHA